MVRAAAVYCRISQDADGRALGVKRQEDDCRALADRKGWPVAEVYVDNDLGAYSGKARPAYRAMLDAIRAGMIDAVIVWHLDRLTRRPAELEDFFDACDAAGIKSLASCTGDVDLSTHDGRFMARILGAVARKESDDKSRRTKRKHLELAQSGAPVGGLRPFGYEADRVTVRPAEASMLRDAVARVLSGESLGSVCREWNDRGLTTARGAAWTRRSLGRILTSPRSAGLRALGGEIVGPAVWEPLLDRATWEQVRALLNTRTRRWPARSYLLTGYVCCGKCGTLLIAQPRADKRRTYLCSSDPLQHGGCGGIRVMAEPLEEYVTGRVLDVLDSPKLAAALANAETPEVAGITDEIAGLDAELANLAADYGAGKVSRGQFVAASAAFEERRARLHDQLGRASASAVLPAGRVITRDGWDSLGLDRQRAIINVLIERVTVGPAQPGANAFDPTRVQAPLGEIRWRV